MSQREDQLSLLIKPSWLSGLAALFVSLAVVIGTVALVNYRGSELKLLKDTQDLQKIEAHEIDYEGLEEGLTAYNLISDIPLFLIWGAVGLVAYSFTMSIAGTFQRAVEFEHELDYVHADKQKLVKEAFIHLGARLGFLIAWFLYLQLTLHFLLPYVIALSYAATGDISLLTSIIYIVVASAVAFVGLHLHVVLLRLICLRPRVFGQA
jgi:hypothetical protein